MADLVLNYKVTNISTVGNGRISVVLTQENDDVNMGTGNLNLVLNRADAEHMFPDDVYSVTLSPKSEGE